VEAEIVAMTQMRMRITFSKGHPLKYISHLDLALTWTRALRRAGVPLAYSQGYNPQAKLQLASGLPLGYTAAAEVMDVILTDSMHPEELIACLEPALPKGLSIADAEEVPLKSPSLQSALRQAVYRVAVETSLSEEVLNQSVARLMTSDQLEQQRVRKGRVETFDLRPLVDDVRLEAKTDGQALFVMRLSAGQHGNVRPDAVLTALGLEDAISQVERTQLLFEFDKL
jgi:radical SAM-linked protein